MRESGRRGRSKNSGRTATLSITKCWNEAWSPMNFSGGNKGALRIPSLSFQYLRRPGCTAKLLCFLIAGRFESHRLHQLFTQKSDSKNFKGHQGHSLSHLRRQYEADDFAVRLAFAFVHGFAVDVHRRTDVGVAHKFLLHFHRSPGFIKQGSECVPAS